MSSKPPPVVPPNPEPISSSSAVSKPGPQFKPLLETVRDAQLNGEIGTKEEALALVDR
jgi:hypothetical protein